MTTGWIYVIFNWEYFKNNRLLADEKYTNTASSIGSERAMTGVVNKIRGVEVLVSDNLSEGTEYIVYSTDYMQAGDEWKIMPTIVDLKDGVHIGASVLQGRAVYWDELTRAYGARVKSTASYTVTFTVSDDAGTPALVEDATIEINGETLETNASGVSTIDLTDGVYAYTVYKTGYTTVNASLTVDGGVVAEAVTLPISA